MPNYVATYLVADTEISWNTDGTKTLADVAGQQSYLQIRVTGGSVLMFLDLSQYILRESNLVLTTTLSALALSLTDRQIAGYTTTLPLCDPLTGGVASRIDAYDALAAIDTKVSWTSIGSPGIRDDIYQRSFMNDLVISSSTRDFSNSFVSVNGVFHKTYLYEGELYVQGGFSNIKNTRKINIGVYDTGPVGGHKVLPIHINNIDAANNTPFSGVTLTFPHIDFTGKTLMLVLDGYLHAMDDAYRIINTNRVVIDTCKIDLINDFLHNPNTLYTKVGVADAVFEDRLKTHRDTPPTVRDKIMYYLWNTYPTAASVTTTEANLVAFYPDTEYESPTVVNNIYSFLATYNTLIPPEPVMLTDYEWSMKYDMLTNVVGTIPTKKFTDPAFIYNLLLSQNTFFIVINNADLYTKTYELTRTSVPGQYVHYGQDTPRGPLFYNHQSVVPYLLYSDSHHQEHSFSFAMEKSCCDVYKTSLNPIAIPSPLFDLKNNQLNYTANLLELYTK